MSTQLTRHPPAVDKVLAWPGMQALISCHGRSLLLTSVRAGLQQWRQGEVSDDTSLLAWVQADVARRLAPGFKPVFNLTGTVLHTNLGRAPLPPEAIKAMSDVASGASN
ncbi:MAG: L-seryl-tRNA(Sec) selenium transferase, partial [Gammaproteobacteria bacterium]|nr:L-seryl-tRNA(Sec) selenium transferase [Gammaproteobacteria bacterium]